MKSVIRWQERIIEVLILLKLAEQCRSLSGYRLLIIVGWLLSILAPASLPVLADSDDDPSDTSPKSQKAVVKEEMRVVD